MSEASRDLLLLLTVGALLLAGIGLDLTTEDAEPVAAERSGSAFFERAQFCPARILREGSGADLAVATASDEAIPVGLDPLEPEPLELAAGSAAVRPIEGDQPIAVEGFGWPVVSTTSHFVDTSISRSGAVEGAGAGNCAANASTSWYFPGGDSSVATDYRIVVANPFPDEAVVQLNLFTPEGREPSAQLAEVAVPSGEVEVVSVSGAALPQDLISVHLRSVRGRVIAWKALWTKPEGEPPGLEFGLGAPALATEWYFPAGEVGDDARQTITLFNPSEEESSVSVSLGTDEEPVQSSKLIEIVVPPESSKELMLADRLDKRTRNVGGISAVVSVDNDVPIAADSSTTFDGDEPTGRISEVGATSTSDAWLVGPPAIAPATDTLIVQNPSTRDASVDVVIYDGAPDQDAAGTAPERLQGITVPAGLRAAIPLEDFVGTKPYFVAVTSTGGEVVVERFASVRGRSDLSSVMGQPDFGRPQEIVGPAASPDRPGVSPHSGLPTSPQCRDRPIFGVPARLRPANREWLTQEAAPGTKGSDGVRGWHPLPYVLKRSGAFSILRSLTGC
ncbi:MAG: DUF5719 family protein [Actinomycetota bacterium]